MSAEPKQTIVDRVRNMEKTVFDIQSGEAVGNFGDGTQSNTHQQRVEKLLILILEVLLDIRQQEKNP